jgi:hypothetical protein
MIAHRKSSTEDSDTAWEIRDLHHQEERVLSHPASVRPVAVTAEAKPKLFA